MYKYIVIDDESLIRQGTIKKLDSFRDKAVCVGEASNGKEGIALIEEQHPDIVILDMQMPVMDGTELLPLLSANYPEISLIVISGYKDFEYVRHAIAASAIDYVLKPFGKEAIQKAFSGAMEKLASKSQLENQIQTSEEQREEAFYESDLQLLTNLILGYHVTSHSLRSRKLGYLNDTHNMYLVTLSYQTIHPDIHLQMFLSENGFGDLALYLPHPERPQLGFLILFIPQNPGRDTGKLIQQIVHACILWLEQQNLKVTAGISDEHQDLAELHDAFSESADALNTQLLLSGSSMYYFYEEKKASDFIVWPEQEELLFRIEAGLENEVQALTNSLFEFYRTVSGCTLGDVKYHCFHLSALCRNVLSYYFKQDLASSSNSMQNMVTFIFSLDELQNYYLNFFLNICRMISDKSVYAGDDVIEKIQIYTQRNFQKDLNLEFVSSLFYMNRSYLSHLFHQRTKQKYVDYVNQVRIEKAQELLLTSDKKMYQIAKSCGYDNVKYFFRIFKKVTGVTPAQYQENRS